MLQMVIYFPSDSLKFTQYSLINIRQMKFWSMVGKHAFEPPLDKTNKLACAPSEDSDQPGHPPSLIRVFAVHIKKAWVLSYPLSAQRRLWSDWADAQADPSLRWAHCHFVCFVMRRLISHLFGIMASNLLSVVLDFSRACLPCSENQLKNRRASSQESFQKNWFKIRLKTL